MAPTVADQNGEMSALRVGDILRYYASSGDEEYQTMHVVPKDERNLPFIDDMTCKSYTCALGSGLSLAPCTPASISSTSAWSEGSTASGDDKSVGSDDEIAPLASLDDTSVDNKSTVILAIVPQKNQQARILATIPPTRLVDQSVFLQCDDPPQRDHQSVTCVAPGSGVFHRQTPPGLEFLAAERVCTEFHPELSQVALSRAQILIGDDDKGLVGSALCDTISIGDQAPCPEQIQGDDAQSKQKKRDNKASKNRRDRYKALVDVLKRRIEADPTVEITSLLHSLPGFVDTDEKLKAKLVARLAKYQQELNQAP